MTRCARWVGLAVTMGLLGVAPTATQAAAGYGSAAFLTARPCVEAAADACAQTHATTDLAAGGKNQSAQIGFDLGNGSASSMKIGTGEDLLPQMRGAVTSSGDQRIGANG